MNAVNNLHRQTQKLLPWLQQIGERVRASWLNWHARRGNDQSFACHRARPMSVADLGRSPIIHLQAAIADIRSRRTHQLHSSYQTRMVLALLLVVLVIGAPPPANAQAVTWSQQDIGGATPAGTFGYDSGTHTYTITGGGAGVQGTNDGCTFVFTRASGNLEMIAHITSITNTNGAAMVGVMIRGSNDPRSRQAMVGITPSAGATFVCRTSDGGNDTRGTSYGPVAPTWVRLVISGTTVSGYYSSDGISWSQIPNPASISLPTTYYAGFVVSSAAQGTACTGVYDRFSFMPNVPQPSLSSPKIGLWLRPDVGVTYSGGKVSAWTDQSNSHYSVTQSNSTNQPTLNTGAINGFASIGFDGTSKYMTLSGMPSLTSGLTIFAVIEPTTASANQRILDDAGSTSDLALMETDSTGSAGLYVNTGSGQQLTASTTLNSYQTLEITQDGSGNTTAFINAQQENSGTVQNISGTMTTYSLGRDSTGANYFAGNICELLVFTQALTAAQRETVETYLYGKYLFGAPTAATPVIAPNINQVFASPQTITVTDSSPAMLFVTTDGSAAGQTSAIYQAPITVSSGSVEVQAMAGGPNWISSFAGPVFIQVDPNTAAVPRSGLSLWLKADNGIAYSSGSNVGTWFDSSGNSFSLPESGNASLVTPAINGQPAVQFNSNSLHALSPSGSIGTQSGTSIFAVCTPTSSAGANNRFLVELGTGSSSYSNSLSVRQLVVGSADQVQLYSNNSGTAETLTSSSGLLIGANHIIETLQDTSNNGNVFLDQSLAAQGSLQSPTFADSQNFVGGSADGLSTSSFVGNIAELLVYQREVSSGERLLIEQYLSQKYRFPAAPAFGLSAGSLSAPCQVPIRGVGTIHVTTDGSTPTALSPVYTQPIWVNYSQTINAISIVDGIASPVSSATYTLNSSSYPAPNPLDMTPPTITIQLPTATQ